MEDNKFKKKKKKSHIPFRLNILFLLIFFAFSTLVLRLGYVQIVKGQTYTEKLEATRNVVTTVSSPRGLIYDSEGKILAGNESSYALVFTRKPGFSTSQDKDKYDFVDMAEQLNQYINVRTVKDVPDGVLSTKQVTERELKDFYIAIHPEIYDEKLTKAELDAADKNGDKGTKDAYQKVIDRMTDQDTGKLSEEELKVAAIWRKLVQATELTPTIITTQLTDEEMAEIGENLDQFHGMIDTTVAAKRDYPNGQFFFLGNVKEIPKHQDDNYKADGYNLNDLVGTSNLEEQYESVLRGVPSTFKFTKDSSGQVVGNPVETEGRRGNDIQLTVNLDLQKQVGKIIESKIKYAKGPGFGNRELTSAYAVVMDPHTGGVLAAVGRTLDPSTGKFTDTSSATVLNGFEIGSAAKPATLLTGYRNNAVPSILTDKPIVYAKGGGSFKSWSTIGTITPEEALQQSSNIFMARIAGNMAGIHYNDIGSAYQASGAVGPQFINAFKTMRDGYAMFGLGTNTGVDLPYESTGYEGAIPENFGIIHQFAIGQYDQYTPLQMAQYVSTIANGGYRVAPHFLESIHSPGNDPSKLGATIDTYKPKVLNTIPNTDEQFNVVYDGMKMVAQTRKGTAHWLGYDSSQGTDYSPYKIAAKTGTAQIDMNDPELYNETLIAYAPYDDPQIAVAVVVPKMRSSSINSTIGGDIIKYYFDKILKKSTK